MAVGSHSWPQHIECVKQFLETIRASGITLNIRKCTFAKSEVKFVGHLIGSGRRRADPEKVSTVYRRFRIQLSYLVFTDFTGNEKNVFQSQFSTYEGVNYIIA